ncbi:hypothetical protein [Sedimentisphaera salicampi]|nr:hypothetical protein [Sedimentisphaera salicampi]
MLYFTAKGSCGQWTDGKLSLQLKRVHINVKVCSDVNSVSGLESID